METKFDIVSSSRNKIVLVLRKERFICLQFNQNYSKSNAYNLAVLSIASYTQPSLEKDLIKDFLFTQTRPENRKLGFLGAENVNNCFLADTHSLLSSVEKSYGFTNNEYTDTQFFHLETSAYLLLVFRGTEKKLKDYLTDANAALVPFSEGAGRVHGGFHRAFKSIQEDIDKSIPEAKTKPVILCGHSLGGALATLAATYIRRRHQRQVMLYTFGSPRVGDADFVRYFSEINPIVAYRFVHNKDLVTLLPPPGVNPRVKLVALALNNPVFLVPAILDPFGRHYGHLGKEVLLRRLPGNSFSVDVDRKTPAYIRVPEGITVKEDRPLWDTVLSWAQISIVDHLMENYVSILASDLKASVDAYLKTGEKGLESAQKTLEYLDAEVAAMEKDLARLEKEELYGRPAPSDATWTQGSRSDKQTPAERKPLLDEALRNKRTERTLRKDLLTAMRRPGYAQALAKDIVAMPVTPALKREFEYQSRNIKY